MLRRVVIKGSSGAGKSLAIEMAKVARLSAPMALAQLGLMMVGVVDMLMLSRLGVVELAASGLGNAWQWTFLSLGVGLVMGIDPLISQAHGRGDGPGTALAMQRGVVLGLLVSVPICACMLFTRRGLILLGQDAAIAELAGRYNLFKIPTVPSFLVYSALRQYLQGRTLMSPATWVMWIGNVLNAVLNWALIFGRLGMPALGVEGAAIASSLSTAFLVAGVAMWIRVFNLHRGAWRAWDRSSFALQGLVQTARLGFPVGLTLSLEGTAFAMTTWMAGWLGPGALAAHQIVLNLASLSFMVPLGISQGAAIRVGNLIGEGDVEGMRRAVKASMLLGAGVMVISAGLFAVLRFELPRLYTRDAAVVNLAARLLLLAAAFQIFDGTQVVAGGALRGMGRSVAAALVNLLGYYAIALPLGYLLCFVWGQGLPGIWESLVAGLGIVAAALLVWAARTARRPIADLRVQVAGVEGTHR